MKRPNNNPLMWIAGALTGVFASTAMVLILGAVLFLTPRPWPKLSAEMRPFKNAASGTVETKYWAGMLKEHYTSQNGVAEGPAWHYYPSGAVYREMTYRGGLLHGRVRQFAEVPRRGGRRFSQPGPVTRRGALEAEWTYSRGLLNGPYVLLDKKGGMRERGRYVEGRKAEEGA